MRVGAARSTNEDKELKHIIRRSFNERMHETRDVIGILVGGTGT